MSADASVPPLVAYPLPRAIETAIMDLAGRTDILLFGEIHGTREVPRVMAALLPGLARRGYRALALEAPSDARAGLAAWAAGDAEEPPVFYAEPQPDGRGNTQTLALVREAVRFAAGWRVLCFDVGSGTPLLPWAERDRRMARRLLDQWDSACPGARVVGVCGDLHARLADVGPVPRSDEPLWPSLAACLRELRPDARLHTVRVMFAAGSYYNDGIRTIGDEVSDHDQCAAFRSVPSGLYTAELRLPTATPATFLPPMGTGDVRRIR